MKTNPSLSRHDCERRLSKRNEWRGYESEKARLQGMGLSPKAYEYAIRELCRKRGI